MGRTTSAKRASAPTVVTPNKNDNPKKRRQCRPKYWFFGTKGEMDDVFIDNATTAAAYRKDFSDFIETEKSWSRKADYEQFKKQHQDPVLNPPASTSKPKDKENEDIAGQIVKRLGDKNQDCDRMVGYWRTSTTSKVVVAALRCINQFKTETWVWKPEFLVPIIKEYADVMQIADPIVYEAMINMRFGKASDPDKADKNIPLVTIYNPPQEPTKCINIENYRAYTYITIPYEKFNTVTEETEWIESAISRFLFALKQHLASDTFKAILIKLAESRRENYINKMFNPSGKSNFPKFLNAAIVRAEKCNKLTDHVIQTVSNDCMTVLFNNRLAKAKYPVDEDTTSSDGGAEGEQAADSDDIFHDAQETNDDDENMQDEDNDSKQAAI